LKIWLLKRTAFSRYLSLPQNTLEPARGLH